MLGGAGALGALTAAGQLVGAGRAEAATSRGSLPGQRRRRRRRRRPLRARGGPRRSASRRRSVLVVEARDRVGGRLLNHELRDGSVIESGGAFVGPTQNHIIAAGQGARVKTFKEYVEGNNIYVKQTPAG